MPKGIYDRSKGTSRKSRANLEEVSSEPRGTVDLLIEVLKASLAVRDTMRKPSTTAERDRVVSELYALLDGIEQLRKVS